MPDPAEQLARLHQAGFEIQTIDRYPRAVTIVRGECIALYEPQPDGVRPIGRAGWLIGESIGVLVEKGGKKIFQAKSETLEATPKRMEALRKFEDDLNRFLLSTA